MKESSKSNQQLLRTALRGNAGFSVLSATIILFWRDGLIRWLGIPRDFGILFLGIGLIVFAVWLLLNSAQTPIKLPAARTAVVMDLAWVVASIPVLVLAPLTSQGKRVITVIALIVLCFALSQWVGIRRITYANVREVSRD
jgi:hypothetical protein